MKEKKIGFAVTGSYCTFSRILPQMERLSIENEVIPIFSYAVAEADTRFYKAADFFEDVMRITGKRPITSIVDAEPIGPERLLDVLIIAPCTGNTLSKLANAITDTPVLMAAKAHIRNDRPVVIAVSTNDALSGSAKNIGALLNYRNVFFVPMRQDDPFTKERSMVADYSKVYETLEAALEGRQLQPIFI
ncbi:MAG: dipicolinate synthase subunit B [Firmicutes bacterium]|nr:dipicolinate synthase subunit B [Bacillota bacterium]